VAHSEAGRRSGRKPLPVLTSLALLSLASAACAGAPSTLDPHGPGAHRIAGMWWFMLWVSAVVVVVVTVLLLFGIRPRSQRRSDPNVEPRWSHRLILVAGVILPGIVLIVLWFLTLRDTSALSSPERPSVQVEVIGYRWWWKVSYPGHGIVTANEVHIPVGQPVQIRLTSVDVVHSFWVPQLQGKTDMIPGRANHMTIQASRAGVYRGQCAEFCGLQHAKMAFFVVAQPPAQFQDWLAREARPAVPQTEAAQEGARIFSAAPCGACHTIRGTDADGDLGPDLTHFGSRLSIGAGAVPNTRGHLGGWIINSQAIKPGNLMPPIQLDPDELQIMIQYLEGLK
jgi:cytochrome c oxidase subunit II